MKNERRKFVLSAGALIASAWLPLSVQAATPELHRPGVLRVAVYANLPPYAMNGKGIDIALGRALAARLGLDPDIVEFVADEDMGDDLRNMVWRGHYRGTQNMGLPPADLMLHVPVDQGFQRRNDKVTIFGPYHLERMGLARNPDRIPAPASTAAATFEVFTEERIGAEVDTHGSDFLLHVLNGAVKDQVVHFNTIPEAVEAMKRGEIHAVLSTFTQLEGALVGSEGFRVDALSFPEMRVTHWPLGMAVRADRPALIEALGKALAEMQRSGEVARLFAEHGLTNSVP